ncbi:MAG: CcoQ/FixQ family Cbb3-type cytochrome c oxidase assembly chaperone [Bacteroidota bacterium]
MKFINYLEKITNVDIYALSSFSIFFVVFIVMGIWALKADKKMIEEISRLPLDNRINYHTKYLLIVMVADGKFYSLPQ